MDGKSAGDETDIKWETRNAAILRQVEEEKHFPALWYTSSYECMLLGGVCCILCFWSLYIKHAPTSEFVTAAFVSAILFTAEMLITGKMNTIEKERALWKARWEKLKYGAERA